MLIGTKITLFEDICLISFIRQEGEIYYKSIENIHQLAKTNFIKIIALSQYGQLHDISLYAAIKRDFSQIRYEQEVIEHFPIIEDLSKKYNTRPRTVILTILASIIYSKPFQQNNNV
ncbi:hypothetical protein LKM01_29255 [Bacillus pacificus]|uniref:Uncharacterized protein n=1 Tax=Bacillus luti TaxID=2026191 RepID=A0A7V7SAI6_9BACI|nr:MULTISPECIES: hypothetical protein [Bacillus]KAB2444717.1 hypothetical protein F8163_05915 [Bacillus luti]MBD0728244.1 hypothetical protein [Bacillus cereus]MCC2485842.1 hypothetical protein [Bacillus pacificus]MCU4738974.1 hypothetical protein [Bacillus paranthracis]MCU4869120.1 hypothetical protein [Bacillus paranthracis]